MPEGHVIHGIANLINEAFAPHPVKVRSPQERFSEEAAQLDGCALVKAEACGKHLFIEFDLPDPNVVHIHLGLIGHLRFVDEPTTEGQIRLEISNEDHILELAGPQWCVLTYQARKAEVMAKSGPDPLRADANPEIGWRKVHNSSRPIAALLMDQGITAGVGAIYRAEVLFRQRIKPSVPGNELKRSSWEKIWNDLVYLMDLGVKEGQINTVRHEHSPEVTGRAPRIDAHGGEVYVYRRANQPCLVCGSKVRSSILNGRNMYWCGNCQRRH